MKKLYYLILVIITYAFFCLQIQLIGQTITGKVVDANGNGLAGLNVYIYINPDVYLCISESDGAFTYSPTEVKNDKVLPSGYSISNNYPNPFNPKTRIDFSLPKASRIKIEIFNIVGQSVHEAIQKDFNAGNNHIDIELNGLPNGLYFARINMDDKYSVVKKLMLIYGSQHLAVSSNTMNINLKKTSDIKIDSIVITGTNIKKNVFTKVIPLSNGSLELGNLYVNTKMTGNPCYGTPTVTYEGKTYNTVQLGDQCWLKENLDLGKRINGMENQTDNGTIEKYCYYDDPNNCKIYGGLYLWDEAVQYDTTEGVRGICPNGWHIPTKSEFETLAEFVSNDGNALKEIGQGTENGVGTNTSGFSALLVGSRYHHGTIYGLGSTTYFWSSAQNTAHSSWYMNVSYSNSTVYLRSVYKENGNSIRCIKD